MNTFNDSKKYKNDLNSQEGESGIDIWSYLRIVRRRWHAISLTALISVGLTAFFTLRMEKIYRATTTLRIETQAPQVLGRDVEDVVQMGTGSFWSNIEYYETQYKIIESRDVATRVVKQLHLNKDPEFLKIPLNLRHNFESVSVDEAANRLQASLTVEPVKDSRLVKISVDNKDPKRARLYANAIATAYKEQNLESMLQSTVDAVDWLSGRLEDANAKLVESEDNIREFKKENEILSISLEDRENILTAQMTAIATKLTEAQAKRIELESKKSAISKVVNSEDPLATPLESINSSFLIQQLKQKHGELSQEYDQLKQRYGDQFPKIIEFKTRLDRIKKDISREVENILEAVNAELAAAKTTEAGLSRILSDLKSQAMVLSQKELDYNRLEREKINDEKVYDLLLGRSKEADLSRRLRVNNVHILDQALVPTIPIKPRLDLNLALSLVFGLIFGFGFAMLLEFGDRTVKTQKDLEEMGLVFLGIIPSIDASLTDNGNLRGHSTHTKGKQLKKPMKKNETDAPENMLPVNYDIFVHQYPKSQVAESCRSIRTNLLFMSADKPAKRILVTSPSPQEGKTTVAINLAITMAQSESKVLIVDTDLRRPRIHRAFGLRPQTGISTVILGESTLDNTIIKTPIPNLDLLCCGPIPPNPAELMHTESFIRVVNELSERYDRVVFDSPPVSAVTDAAVLSKYVDGALIVVKSLHTTKDSVKHAVSVLSDIKANILGCVLNNLDLANRKYGQHYFYYYYKKYGYYYQAEGADKQSRSEHSDKSADSAIYDLKN